MGGALHRLQVLLVGVTLLIGGAVVVALLYIRPPEPLATAAPEPDQPSLAAPPLDGAPALDAAAGVLRDVWPVASIAAGCVFLIAVAWRATRRRRMALTGQSVRMLLAASDRRTRATNARVLRDLHVQGRLPDALAAAAGLKPRVPWPMLRLPALSLPRVALPALPALTLPRAALPRLRLPQRPAPTIEFTPLPALPTDADGCSVLDEPPVEAADAADAAGAASAAAWSAEDRALAVAGALALVWRERGLTSPITALDTPRAAGAAQVMVAVEPAPADEERLLGVPDDLARAGMRAAWTRQGERALLAVDVAGRGAAPARGPLLAPVLAHGRRDRMLRFLPLDIWRGLGLYGEGALGALHALLTALLYAQAPRDLALAILDGGQVSPLYAGVAHLVAPPDTPQAAVEALREGARRATAHHRLRPLLLVVVEPDAAMLADLAQLMTRLRGRTDAPLHLIVAQERVSEAGRELYALLPAIVAGGGRGDAALVPGQSAWPQPEAARLTARGVSLEGRAMQLTEAEAASTVAPLRREMADLPPVLWDIAGRAAPAAEEAAHAS